MPPNSPPQIPRHHEDPLAITSMVLGIVSLIGFGFITGIPAIILSAMTLSRKTDSRSYSITGLITGIVGTVVSLAIAALVIFILVVVGESSQDTFLGQPSTRYFQPEIYSEV